MVLDGGACGARSVAIPLSTAIDEVVRNAAKTYRVSEEAELHGYDLFQGRSHWRELPPRARIAVYNAAMKTIGAHDVKLILRGVDRHGLVRRYASSKPAHEVVLSHLLERVDGYAAQCEEFALVIADEVDNPATHRSDLRRYRVAGTGGYRSRRLTRIVDTLHFAPSHASRLVQAVDLVTFLYRRMANGGSLDPREVAANERLWSWVEGRRYHSWCWSPASRRMHEGPA
ncbi:DUF3800 domain-containing protein [Micromonospora sp. WMMD1120]|uniref:DUF3800 domain-containing protein n=1 Tax=Micromonospora sp. WMMD1120 TaxID=3016106 RepID=UPI0024168EC2|nr:DUF3800 domain-containing protein [Micromonospora sp. WMMD1120]MDG4807492.1 DUF3800 domain-containing protein [Micromonospora sp. WMMD1120]